MLGSRKVGRRRVSVIAAISTYLQRGTCFTDWRDIIRKHHTHSHTLAGTSNISSFFGFLSLQMILNSFGAKSDGFPPETSSDQFCWSKEPF